ncbi:MAG: hypothetical protein ACRD72_14915, partial [Candidatus Angelobacter sp.]
YPNLDTRRFAGCLLVFRAEATRYGSPQGLSRVGSARVAFSLLLKRTSRYNPDDTDPVES